MKDTGEGPLGAAGSAGGAARIVWALVQAMNCVHRYFLKMPLFGNYDALELVRTTEINYERLNKLKSRSLRSLSDLVDETRMAFTEALRKLHLAVTLRWIDKLLGPAAEDRSWHRQEDKHFDFRLFARFDGGASLRDLAQRSVFAQRQLARRFGPIDAARLSGRIHVHEIVRQRGWRCADSMTTMISVFRLAAALALGALCMLGFNGCDPAPGVAAVAQKPSSGGASVLIDSVNYMHERGVRYTLYDLSQTPPRAVGGATVYMLGTGGEKGCCLLLPRTWHPGIMVRLEWIESDRQQTYPEKRTQDLEIPHYDTPADLYVVFYPPHDVELVVSAGEPGNPAWAGRNKKTPWQQCVESYGRKPCFMALPKQFDTRSSQGTCTYMKEEHVEDSDILCLTATKECVRDYEDADFCKGILWGARRK